MLAVAFAALFLAAPDVPFVARSAFAVIVVALPLAAVWFLDALRPRRELIGSPGAAMMLGLALPGLLGCGMNAAIAFAWSGGLSREIRQVAVYCWFMLTVPLVVTSMIGLIASVHRTSRVRVVAVLANGAFLVWTAAILYGVFSRY
jgi:hypothetical protein